MTKINEILKKMNVRKKMSSLIITFYNSEKQIDRLEELSKYIESYISKGNYSADRIGIDSFEIFGKTRDILKLSDALSLQGVGDRLKINTMTIVYDIERKPIIIKNKDISNNSSSNKDNSNNKLKGGTIKDGRTSRTKSNRS